MNKWLSWQSLVAGLFFFFVGYGTQVYAFASWQTATDLRLVDVESIVKEFHENNKIDHDKLIILDERTQNMLDRLDKIGTDVFAMKDSLAHK